MVESHMLIDTQTMEVATARVYNWDVGQRRKENAEDKGGAEGDRKGPPNG